MTGHTTLTCPACGLLCDDITPSNNNCARSIAFFTQDLGDISAKIRGRSVSLEEAVVHAADLLKDCRKPLFAGLSTDVAGFKAIHHLAQKTNGVLQHINAQSMARNLKALQSAGWQTATLTEVKNRADLILCIGSDIASHNPRFFERFVDAEGMFVQSRNVVFLGEKIPAIRSDALKSAWLLACKPANLPSVLAALRAVVSGKSLKTSQIADLEVSDLQALADKLKAAKFPVLTWVAKDLDFPHAELVVEQITQIVAALNHTTRAAVLPLGGSDGDTSANYAHTWLNGSVLEEANNTPPDLQIWVNSFNHGAPPAVCHTPTIILGNANTAWGTHAEVWIPVATPGLDCAGTMFRVDGAVSLPLKKVRKNNLPTLAKIVHEIEARLK